MLKYLSHIRLGCNHKFLLPLYKSLVRSQLDYGAQVCYQVRKSTIKLLDAIQAASLRLSQGAFCTNPHLSLYAETVEPPFLFRALTLAANFLASSAQSLNYLYMLLFTLLRIRSSSHSKPIFNIFPNLIFFSQLNHKPLHGYSFLQLLDSICKKLTTVNTEASFQTLLLNISTT